MVMESWGLMDEQLRGLNVTIWQFGMNEILIQLRDNIQIIEYIHITLLAVGICEDSYVPKKSILINKMFTLLCDGLGFRYP